MDMSFKKTIRINRLLSGNLICGKKLCTEHKDVKVMTDLACSHLRWDSSSRLSRLRSASCCPTGRGSGCCSCAWTGGCPRRMRRAGWEEGWGSCAGEAAAAAVGTGVGAGDGHRGRGPESTRWTYPTCFPPGGSCTDDGGGDCCRNVFWTLGRPTLGRRRNPRRCSLHSLLHCSEHHYHSLLSLRHSEHRRCQGNNPPPIWYLWARNLDDVWRTNPTFHLSSWQQTFYD